MPYQGPSKTSVVFVTAWRSVEPLRYPTPDPFDQSRLLRSVLVFLHKRNSRRIGIASYFARVRHSILGLLRELTSQLPQQVVNIAYGTCRQFTAEIGSYCISPESCTDIRQLAIRF